MRTEQSILRERHSPMKGLEGFRKEIPYALRHGAGSYVLVIDAKGHGRKE